MREATRQDRPMVGTIQAQCCMCWRIFSSDSLCEKAKPYARLPEETGTGKRGRVAERSSCIDPLELGLVSRERSDGVAIWGLVDSEESERRAQNLAKARAVRGRR